MRRDVRALGRGGALLIAALVSGCDSELVAGKWKCTTPPDPAGPHDGGTTYPLTDPIPVPWTTSFEDGFCGYGDSFGFCYTEGASNGGAASIELDTSRAHSGHRSMKFSVTTYNPRVQLQARCVREGVLPADAYYGAWYYLSRPITNNGNWNLMHVQGGDGMSAFHNLWDVSLGNTAAGGLNLYVFDALNNATYPPTTMVEIPIGSWFYVEFHLVRAADDTGKVALYQDGTLLVEVGGISTDDSKIGQFYVGNLANALSPAEAIVYVDDVSIRATP